MRLGNVDWGNRHSGGGESNGNGGDRNDKDNSRTLQNVQFTVATSTFSVVAFMGLFCTCLWVACCRPKRQGRIRGRQWTVNNTFAVPVNGGHPLHSPHQGFYNPYVINPGFYSAESNLNSLNTSNGLYHPSATDIFGGTKDEKVPPDSTYRPFFAKVEWEPPGPPTYQSLGFDNPTYGDDGNNVLGGIDAKKSVYNNVPSGDELIKEKVPVGVLATPDPSKVSQPIGKVQNVTAASSGDESTSDKEAQMSEESTGDKEPCSAPPESLMSIESKDHGANLYPDGIKEKKLCNVSDNGDGNKGADGIIATSKDESSSARMEELDPPPFNPSYLFGTEKASAAFNK